VPKLKLRVLRRQILEDPVLVQRKLNSKGVSRAAMTVCVPLDHCSGVAPKS
jgi:hypothetical protein